MVVKLGCYYLVQFTTTLANDCLVLSFTAVSITSDSVMPSNGSFFTVVNTFDLERKMVLIKLVGEKSGALFQGP